MLDFLKKLTGYEGGSSAGPTIAELVQDGAQIVDVRTPDEFANGHIAGSINLPLQSLDRNLAKLRKDKPVITCCASGMRSASAKGVLESRGFSVVVNGGGWVGLQRRLNA